MKTILETALAAEPYVDTVFHRIHRQKEGYGLMSSESKQTGCHLSRVLPLQRYDSLDTATIERDFGTNTYQVLRICS